MSSRSIFSTVDSAAASDCQSTVVKKMSWVGKHHSSWLSKNGIWVEKQLIWDLYWGYSFLFLSRKSVWGSCKVYLQCNFQNISQHTTADLLYYPTNLPHSATVFTSYHDLADLTLERDFCWFPGFLLLVNDGWFTINLSRTFPFYSSEQMANFDLICSDNHNLQ